MTVQVVQWNLNFCCESGRERGGGGGRGQAETVR